MEDKQTQEALDKFGKLLMERVRDWAVADWDNILLGRSKNTDTGRAVEKLIADGSFTEQQIAMLLEEVVPRVIDTTLHYMLWMLDQEKSIELAVHTELGTISSLREVSDGLVGDYFEWAPRYSKRKFHDV